MPAKESDTSLTAIEIEQRNSMHCVLLSTNVAQRNVTSILSHSHIEYAARSEYCSSEQRNRSAISVPSVMLWEGREKKPLLGTMSRMCVDGGTLEQVAV